MDIGKTVLSPCKDCADRWVNTETLERCHSNCTKYEMYRKQLDINREKYFREKKEKDAMFDSKRKISSRSKGIKNNMRKKQEYRTS